MIPSRLRAFTKDSCELITDFEIRVAKELKTLKCKIVFSGKTSEAIVVRKELINNTADCMNKRTIVKQTLGKLKSHTLTLKREFVKLMKSATNTLYFIDIEYGYRLGLKEKMTGMYHPMHKGYIQLQAHQIELI